MLHGRSSLPEAGGIGPLNRATHYRGNPGDHPKKFERFIHSQPSEPWIANYTTSPVEIFFLR